MIVERATCFLLVGCVAIAGCGDTASSGASQSASAPIKAASAAPSAAGSNSAGPRKPRGDEPRGGGTTAMLFHAAKGLELKDTQQADITKLEAALHAEDGSPKPEMKDMSTDLVAQVKAGKIDAAKLEPRFAAIDKAIQAHQQKEVDALNGLYALLDPAQRKAAAADARAKIATREERMEQHKEDHADAKDKDKGGDWAKMKLEHLTKELDLDATQQKTVEGILAKQPDAKTAMTDRRAERKKNTEALLAAFEADGFDAKKLDLYSGKEKARDPFDKEVAFLGQLVPVLKPDQRDKLATQLESRTSRGGGRPGGPPEMGPSWPMLFDDNHGGPGGMPPGPGGAPPPGAPGGAPSGAPAHS